VIEPAHEQLEYYGMEYLVALRHDPGSQTSPLSTTIQTAMLLARMLDPPGGGASGGAFGERLFAFTDRLDSVNRLYWDLLDAEGWWRLGSPVRRYAPHALATLRAPDVNELPLEAQARRQAGQSWDFSQVLGHRLLDDRQLGVGRTTSQDAGVEAQAEIIAATASLEVGFDDDRVGAVIQHKAPHDGARFLQRKGRAGRREDGRPWTAVVLSDFGRDRVAYQSYDQLFSPSLEPRRLPVGNRYVIRMQAVYCLIDWLCHGAGLGPGWRALAEPAAVGSQDEDRQHRAASMLEAILEQPGRLKTFSDHLQRSLRLNDDDVHAVLWEAPRPLLTSVVPTLLRRLKTAWSDGVQRGGEPHGSTPLPEFAPASLFSDLLVPEVSIDIPAHQHGGHPVIDVLPVESAVRELCPGNVTRRYAITDRSERHWAPLPDAPTVDLDQLAHYTWAPQGRAEWMRGGHSEGVWCLRPLQVRLEQTPAGVTDGWKAMPLWRSAVEPLGPGRELPSVERSVWRSVIVEARTVLHRDDTAARISRVAPEVEVTRRVGGAVAVERIAFTTGPNNESAGIGFSYEGDGLRLLVSAPDDSGARGALSGSVLAESRAAYMYDCFERGVGFPDHVSVFQRHWLRVALLIALLREREQGESGLRQASDRLAPAGLGAAMEAACEALFRAAIDTDADADDDGGDPPAVRRGQLHAGLVALCHDDAVMRAVGDLAAILHADPDVPWLAWERSRFAATVGAVFVEAAADLCAEVDVDELVVDLLETDDATTVAVWITEASPGGAGILERIADRWIADPSRFLRVMRRHLGPSDFEALDEDLTRVVSTVGHDIELRDAFAGARAAWTVGHEAAAEGIRTVRDVLAFRGIVTTRHLLVAINTRLLAPGTGSLFDELLGDFIEWWSATEAEVGVALEGRVVAALFVDDDRIDDALHLNLSASAPTPADRYAALLAVCWPRSADLRSVALAAPNRYYRLPPSTRLRVLDWLQLDESLVAVGDDDELVRQLAAEGTVLVGADAAQLEQMRHLLLSMATTPVDCGFLLSHARVASAERSRAGLTLRLELPEVQG
jgi:hypothetical protein